MGRSFYGFFKSANAEDKYSDYVRLSYNQNPFGINLHALSSSNNLTIECAEKNHGGGHGHDYNNMVIKIHYQDEHEKKDWEYKGSLKTIAQLIKFYATEKKVNNNLEEIALDKKLRSSGILDTIINCHILDVVIKAFDGMIEGEAFFFQKIKKSTARKRSCVKKQQAKSSSAVFVKPKPFSLSKSNDPVITSVRCKETDECWEIYENDQNSYNVIISKELKHGKHTVMVRNHKTGSVIFKISITSQQIADSCYKDLKTYSFKEDSNMESISACIYIKSTELLGLASEGNYLKKLPKWLSLAVFNKALNLVEIEKASQEVAA